MIWILGCSHVRFTLEEAERQGEYDEQAESFKLGEDPGHAYGDEVFKLNGHR